MGLRIQIQASSNYSYTSYLLTPGENWEDQSKRRGIDIQGQIARAGPASRVPRAGYVTTLGKVPQFWPPTSFSSGQRAMHQRTPAKTARGWYSSNTFNILNLARSKGASVLGTQQSRWGGVFSASRVRCLCKPRYIPRPWSLLSDCSKVLCERQIGVCLPTAEPPAEQLGRRS